ncbi:hypothetical protein Q7C36_004185 [Tachysurus vachellii]|uniref:C-C motif chemokine n=1 Tax=Tachysurus vachellii TaxID=175792 RepID=A0AA88NJR9_TACVA|nr:hypothetical protein Q7C36_004185 [Tachysurus vachellii]
MISRSLLLVLLVLACLQSFTTAQNGNVPEEYQCCFRFQIQPIPVRVIKEYEVTDIRCTKPGVIFTLQNGRHVCADPSFKWMLHQVICLEVSHQTLATGLDSRGLYTFWGFPSGIRTTLMGLDQGLAECTIMSLSILVTLNSLVLGFWKLLVLLSLQLLF